MFRKTLMGFAIRSLFGTSHRFPGSLVTVDNIVVGYERGNKNNKNNNNNKKTLVFHNEG